MSQEIELKLQLDKDGRTSLSQIEVPSEDDGNGIINQPDVIGTKKVDYKSKCMFTKLAYNDETLTNDEGKKKLMDDLLYDCEISDSGLLPRTFWMPSKDVKPRCILEQCAHEIFHKHVPKDLNYDSSTSGAEWWVQIRPSPPAGRYSMHAKEEDDTATQDDDMAKTGISFHWDKDEDLRLLMGGSMYIHPHLSTVTYMTSIGSPTMALDLRIHPLTGEWIAPKGCILSHNKSQNNHQTNNINNNEKDEQQVSTATSDQTNGLAANDTVNAYLSWPERGKHLSFDGRFLHAAPGDLMEPGEFERQIQFHHSSDPKENRLKQRRHRRVTFLVNIWLNYKPFNVNMFPETMLDKLTKVSDPAETILFHNTQQQHKTDECTSLDTIINDQLHCDELKRYDWPLGACGCGETISLPIPFKTVQNSRLQGNCKMSWISRNHDYNVHLVKDNLEINILDQSENCNDSDKKQTAEKDEEGTQRELKRPKIEPSI